MRRGSPQSPRYCGGMKGDLTSHRVEQALGLQRAPSPLSHYSTKQTNSSAPRHPHFCKTNPRHTVGQALGLQWAPSPTSSCRAGTNGGNPKVTNHGGQIHRGGGLASFVPIQTKVATICSESSYKRQKQPDAVEPCRYFPRSSYTLKRCIALQEPRALASGMCAATLATNHPGKRSPWGGCGFVCSNPIPARNRLLANSLQTQEHPNAVQTMSLFPKKSVHPYEVPSENLPLTAIVGFTDLHEVERCA